MFRSFALALCATLTLTLPAHAESDETINDVARVVFTNCTEGWLAVTAARSEVLRITRERNNALALLRTYKKSLRWPREMQIAQLDIELADALHVQDLTGSDMDWAERIAAKTRAKIDGYPPSDQEANIDPRAVRTYPACFNPNWQPQ